MRTAANTIRQQFIDFFVGKSHQFIKSAPVVPQDDPTLLFTNAGMNQFKAIFLGENPRGLSRAVNSQKCMRVSGKHNDLEEVGRDHYHHTLFEMLGNWSFGDYYKKEAIRWAWEFLTDVVKLPKDRLFVTVYTTDDEAKLLWEQETDIAPSRVLRFAEKENFWEMGDTGPCGPCSEIHFDMGDEATREQTFADPVLGVNGQNDRYREIWNLVFIQYNRQKDGSLEELPLKHVDTGMGFERLVTVLQGVRSNYETDLFMPLIRELERLSGKSYSSDVAGTPFRVIADHIRALTFSITDGAFPSNEGRGYVLRRLLRRAYRFGRELGFSEPFLYKLVPTLVKMMGEAFPEIGERQDYLQEVIRAEEQRFGQTLEQGLERFNTMVSSCRAKGNDELAGADVFQLYDTYGFPMDLTRLMAQEQGLRVDEQSFEALMLEQRERAREATRKADTGGLTADGWIDLAAAEGTVFVGYEHSSVQARVYRFKPLSETHYLVLLDKTPFYAESGGQLGDSGLLTTASGKQLVVEDAFKWNDSTIHKVSSAGKLTNADFAQPLTALVNSQQRDATRRNHSATHLLQAALREVLGEHVQQSGSRVDANGLRFDFTHFKGVSAGELLQVQALVNQWILENLPVSTAVESLEQARAAGATALFGEKYGDSVRVVSMGGISKELCGGTHVATTAQIGSLHIVSECSTSAGVRRIEAITGEQVNARLVHTEQVVGQLCGVLKVNQEKLVERVEEVMASVRELEAKLAELSAGKAASAVVQLLDEARAAEGGLHFVVKNLGAMDKDSFEALANALSDELRRQGQEPLAFMVGAAVQGKALFAAGATDSAVSGYGVHSGELVRAAAKIAGGGGGGSPVRAQAGGKDAAKLEEALEQSRQTLGQKVSV
jgi:alanyl-tRNA synthetase